VLTGSSVGIGLALMVKWSMNTVAGHSLKRRAGEKSVACATIR
jgi:hypothetical protein